jgi:hypothetical protein
MANFGISDVSCLKETGWAAVGYFVCACRERRGAPPEYLVRPQALPATYCSGVKQVMMWKQQIRRKLDVGRTTDRQYKYQSGQLPATERCLTTVIFVVCVGALQTVWLLQQTESGQTVE